MIGQRSEIWRKEEYDYPAAYGFIPLAVSYLHEDKAIRPCMVVAPGGAYQRVSPAEGDVVARYFYEAGYNVFVLVYTTNPLDQPLKTQPLQDISRAIRLIRAREREYRIDPEKVAVCGFSAGAHLCGSLCVHNSDIRDPRPEYDSVPNRPDAAVLAYPVISSGKYAHRDSFRALFGEGAAEEELEYMSLEKHVTGQTPPCFLWQTASDGSVPVENSYLFAKACRKAGVSFAHHVFSEGVHGMSLASKEWLEGKYRDPYTLEQTFSIIRAIEEGRTKYPKEKGNEILERFELTGTGKETWIPEDRDNMLSAISEVGMWPELAKRWLERELKL